MKGECEKLAHFQDLNFDFLATPSFHSQKFLSGDWKRESMAAMETSEVVEVLREIRDIQRKTAQFQRKMSMNLMGFAISVVAFIAMIAVGGSSPGLAAILGLGGLIVFVIACISLCVDLFSRQS